LAGNWQLKKGLNLSHKNSSISSRASMPPSLNPDNVNARTDQWKILRLDGKFLESYHLIKNQYQDGAYGFHVLQDFDSQSLGRIKVDRGWVKAGSTAQTSPAIPPMKFNNEQVVVRVRSEFLNTHLGGTFFAMPAQRPKTREIYFDFLSGTLNSPITVIDLPDLSTGPHFAYAFQWIIFALAILAAAIISTRKLNSKADRP
jgi:cytochrome oxidase assembly protein ShyY1